jgi:hypothetical protein
MKAERRFLHPQAEDWDERKNFLLRGLVSISQRLLKILNLLLFAAQHFHKISVVDLKIIDNLGRIVMILA